MSLPRRFATLAERIYARLGDGLALALTGLAIYVAGFGVFDNAVVSGGTVVLGVLIVLLSLRGPVRDEVETYGFGWAIFVAVAAIVFVALMWIWLRVMFAQEEFFIEFTLSEHLAAWLAFVILGWLTWRLFGLPMALVYAFGLLYVLFGDQFPGIFRGASEDWRRVAENLWYSTDGAFGRPVEVVSRVVLIYIVFGAVLQASGAGHVLLRLANAATGRFSGGPAHAAIVGSALFGSMSGSAISNVVSTGVFTIPIIKRAGFRPAFAGAVEAAASTGGQIMPPVMGVVAFLMADVTGIPYLMIVAAATLPALLYYASLFAVVLIEARKSGVRPLPAHARERLSGREWLQSLALVVPLGIIIAVLLTGRTPQAAGFAALITGTVLCLALFPDFRSIARLRDALITAGRTGATIMLIVAAIGVVIGVVNMTGVGLRFAEAILGVSGENLFVSLLLVMLGCLILGMGVPTGAAYLIIALVMGPALQRLGLPIVISHLFVVYFGVLSTVTPPVALAAFAAAPIAGSKPLETGFEATRLAIAGFIIPFLFVYHPSIVLIEGVDPLSLAWALAVFVISTWSLATGLAGFEARGLALWERVARVAAGLVVIVPQVEAALPAGALAVALVGVHRLRAQPAPANQ